MRVGKIVSLILAVTGAAAGMALAEVAASLDIVAGLSPLGIRAVQLCAFALGLAVVLLPFGFLIDRAVQCLCATVDQASREPGYIPTTTSRWLTPLTHAIIESVRTFHDREQELRTHIREIEIQHRITEADRRQIEAVLHSLRDCVIVTDAFNEVVMVNESAAKALSFNAHEAIHQPVQSLVADERIVRLIAEARDTGNAVERRHVEHEVTIVDDDGQSHSTVYGITLSCVENHLGDVSGVVTILRDTTHEREVSEMKSDFVSKASHELRTPLSSIRAYIEMLVDGEAQDDAAREEFYGIIHHEAERLGRLIDNMLNISRIEAGIVQIDRDQVDMQKLIQRAVDTIEPQAREKEITLNCKLAPVDLCIEGDEDMMYQVVLNLLSNSVKYTPEGGRVTVAADSDNLTRSVLVTVSDTGLGIPPDAIPKLFDKFFRIENYKRVAKGTGLGLSLCKHIIETLHRGQIGVESKLGMGSKFWFSVPMRYAGSQAAA